MNVCMLAYAHYLNDARIKSYVRTLEAQGNSVDVIALRSDRELPTEALAAGTIFRVMTKYQGRSTLLYIWSYWKFLLKSSLLLTRLSLRRRYSVVHVHNMPNALVFAGIVPKLLGSRLILDVHDLMTANYMAKFNAREGTIPVRALKLEQRLSALFAYHVFCADHNQQDYLVEHCGLNPEKVSVMMNLPNVDSFHTGTIKTSEAKSDIFRIVYHGTIAHRLGIDLIIKAMAQAVARVPAELWLYGSGDYLPEALALSSQLGLERKIHFSREFFPVERIPELVAGMHLGIIGNRRNLACDRYMLPVKLLEYVYLGIPVLAPRLDVITRYFDNTMVRYYEPENVEQLADSIVELFHNREERERLAVSASAFYQQHNIKAQGDRYLDLLTRPEVSLPARAAERHL